MKKFIYSLLPALAPHRALMLPCDAAITYPYIASGHTISTTEEMSACPAFDARDTPDGALRHRAIAKTLQSFRLPLAHGATYRTVSFAG
eukprot:9014162-Pyramimonas_sp.AAC.1